MSRGLVLILARCSLAFPTPPPFLPTDHPEPKSLALLSNFTGVPHYPLKRVPRLPAYPGGTGVVHPGVSERYFPAVCDLGEGLPVDSWSVHRDEEGEGGHSTREKNAQQVHVVVVVVVVGPWFQQSPSACRLVHASYMIFQMETEIAKNGR